MVEPAVQAAVGVEEPDMAIEHLAFLKRLFEVVHELSFLRREGVGVGRIDRGEEGLSLIHISQSGGGVAKESGFAINLTKKVARAGG